MSFRIKVKQDSFKSTIERLPIKYYTVQMKLDLVIYI